MKRQPYSLSKREDPDKEQLTYRTYSLRQNADGRPASLDEETRSVEVVGATENPVAVFDYERWEVVNEVLLMSGCQLPDSRQIVLMDSHQRSSTASVIGSYRDMKAGRELTGRAYFSSLPEGEGPYTKVREGHLTDFSVAYKVLDSEWVPEGKTATIQGRKYKGPVKVATRWVPKELSICPIGADEQAKARTDHQHVNPKEDGTMNKRLRKWLIARGMNPEATEEEAWAFLDGLELPEEDGGRNGDEHGERNQAGTGEAGRQQPEPSPDPEEITREAIREERARTSEINAMCRRFDISDELRDKLIADGASVLDARDAINTERERRLQENAAQTPGFSPIRMQADERDKFRAAATHAIMIRGNIDIAEPAPGADDLTGYSLRELARMSLQMAGRPTNGSPLEMVGRAMVSSDFPHLLADSANKSLFAGYDTAPETWQTWCGIGQASDFKTHSMPRVSEMDDLDEIPEHGKYKYGERSEAKEEYQITTYGKLFAITRQAIINDDLSALTNIPRAHGEAAARKVGDLPYAVLTANAAMGDGVALFHSSHGNLGTGGAVSESTIAEAIKLMGLQKDIAGKRRLNISPKFFIAPKSIEGYAEIFFTSNQFTGTNAASTRSNPYAGSRFTRVYESRLDDDSATAYYLAGPKGKTIVVFFLDGLQKPYMETKAGWTVDGVEYKVRIDAAAKAVDWKAILKNAGA